MIKPRPSNQLEWIVLPRQELCTWYRKLSNSWGLANGANPQRHSLRRKANTSRDAFSRGTGSVKESAERSDDGNLGEAGNAGSTWMVVVYVVIGLVAVALLGLLGRRLLSVRSAS